MSENISVHEEVDSWIASIYALTPETVIKGASKHSGPLPLMPSHDSQKKASQYSLKKEEELKKIESKKRTREFQHRVAVLKKTVKAATGVIDETVEAQIKANVQLKMEESEKAKMEFLQRVAMHKKTTESKRVGAATGD